MERVLEERVCRATARTFEELAFMFTDRELSAVQRDAPHEASARVGFRGPVNGCLVVRLFGCVLTTIAGNMLAESEPLDQAMKEDTLREIANVICGNLLPSLAGDSAVFELNPPVSSVAPGEEDAAPFPLVASAAVGLDEGRVEVFLHADASGAGDWRA